MLEANAAREDWLWDQDYGDSDSPGSSYCCMSSRASDSTFPRGGHVYEPWRITVLKRMAHFGLLKQLILWYRVIYITYYKFVFLSKWNDLYPRTSGSVLNVKFSWILIFAVWKWEKKKIQLLGFCFLNCVFWSILGFIVTLKMLGSCPRRFYEEKPLLLKLNCSSWKYNYWTLIF